METYDEQGRLHSYGDKPAVVDTDGNQYFYKNGNRHEQ